MDLDHYIRPAMPVTAIAALAGLIFVASSNLPSALADERVVRTLMSNAQDLGATHAIDASRIVRRGDELWEITADGSVDEEPLHTATVTKIGYGQVADVAITTTSSGVYSSDAMTSPHVLYPGIRAERVYPKRIRSLAYWSGGRWVPSPQVAAGSTVIVQKTKRGFVMVTPGTTCVFTRTIASC